MAKWSSWKDSAVSLAFRYAVSGVSTGSTRHPAHWGARLLRCDGNVAALLHVGHQLLHSLREVQFRHLLRRRHGSTRGRGHLGLRRGLPKNEHD
ncbi:hypothetical protein E2562_001018 [Oryza meyeriana var. granulata]|uniref:Uncharacterized protein n=1 Tax=Oryza meyeriana var. granulata TaxID=110450 RepID=A0A6G1ECZ5_9ORYZ|nr:hypothetical protein E2562_001018 [Oryza meyeriana var. granulata]